MTVAGLSVRLRIHAAVSLTVALLFGGAALKADPPATSYIFPAGGQAGSDVECRVGTLNCAYECGFQMPGAASTDAIQVADRIGRMETLILKGPYHQNPVAQQPWDYPRDMATTLRISKDARPGVYQWYCSTAEGASVLRPFVVGELPEVLEEETRTKPGHPQAVTLPVTINGRMFPRADLDEYRFTASAGEIVSCEVVSHRLGHQLDARLQLRDADGRLVAEADDHVGPDALLITTIPNDGEYVLRIHDIAYEGGQDFVYRLSLRTGPCVTHIYPAGSNTDAGTEIRLHGVGLSEQGFLDCHTSWSESDGWSMPDGVNLFCPFLSSEVPEISESESNGQTSVQSIDLPVVINGRVQERGDLDVFEFTAVEGESFEFEVFGRRLTSPITPVVTIHDVDGNEVARHQGDGVLRLTAGTDGAHTLRISELFRETHAGDRYIYRVAARRSQAGYHLHLSADNTGMEPGADATLKLQAVRRGGFDGEIRLGAQNLPEGVILQTATVPAGKNEVELVLAAAEDAPIGMTSRATITGSAVIGDADVSCTAIVPSPEELSQRPLALHSQTLSPVDTLAVTVTHPQIFSITTTDVYGSANRGATLVQTHHLERLGDFDGEVEISLSEGQDRYLQGVTGPLLTLQSGETEFDYPAFLPESMDLNRTARMVVMGTARVTDRHGRQHYVTHRTKNQMVVRVCPSLLTLDAEQIYFEGRPGETLTIPVRVGRTAEITGDVTVEAVDVVSDLLKDLPALQVSPESEQVQYRIRLSDDAEAGQLCQLQLRATGYRAGYPAVAETSVEVQIADAQ